MPFHFLADESFARSTKRIATELLDQALADISNPEKERTIVVHESRKRCKELRGLLRLIRSGLASYSSFNALIRDAAKLLSSTRDADVLLKTIKKLSGKANGEIAPQVFNKVREQFRNQRRIRLENEIDPGEQIEKFSVRIREARNQVDDWNLDGKAKRILSKGLRDNYDRARVAMEIAYLEPSTDHFHEWRKRVKYHWYHVRLLTPIWQSVMSGFEDALDDLSDDLGDEHDLAVLAETLRSSELILEETVKEQLFALIQAEREGLRLSSRALGMRLYAEKPKAMTSRVRGYWRAWRHETRAIRHHVPTTEPASTSS